MTDIRKTLVTLKDGVVQSPWHVKLVVGLCVLYLLSPIDLIPDFIPVIGQLDDALLLAWLVTYVAKYASEMRDEHDDKQL